MIVNVEKIVKRKEEEIQRKIKENNVVPTLAVIQANDLESSKSYIASKRKKANELGIKQIEYIYDRNVTEEEIINKIIELNEDSNVNGIMVQLPLYTHLNEYNIINSVNPKKDVDGFTSLNIGNIINGNEKIIPCTPKGILLVLNSLNVDLEGKNVVILGRSKIVGRPLAEVLISRGATVTVCNSKTEHLNMYTKEADILIVAVGKARFINNKMVKKDSIVIDVGINKIDGKIVGDVDTDDIKDKVKYVTPVPKGIGITTVISLMDNLVNIAIENFLK